MLCLVTSRHENFDTDFVLVDVRDHAIGLKMSELNWECFECVAFRYIVLDTMLELFSCKRPATYALILIIRESSRKQIPQLVVPVGGHVVLVAPDCCNFVFQDLFKKLFLV